jgi:membrane-bound lytic murein transglycosylase MltF
MCLAVLLWIAGPKIACAAGSELSDISTPAREVADAVLKDLGSDNATSPRQDADSLLSYVNNKWTGDFEGMRKRRMIRALVVYSRTHFFLDKGSKRGVAYDALMGFEKVLNKKLKTKSSEHIYVVCVPVTHDEVMPALIEGRGDLAAANLTVTSGRQKLVDFTDPVLGNVREVVVTAPGVPPIARIEDLAGRQVFVLPSSSYREHLQALSRDFEKKGLDPIQIVATPEQLDIEDLLEMVNAGLIPVTVADSHLADFWAHVFVNMTVHPEAIVNSGGEIAWAVRKDSPQLKAMANDFLRKFGPGSPQGTELFRTYLKNTRWVKNATAGQDMERFRRTVDLFKKYGDLYSFDHLLLAAQGYQESGLDQSMRSPLGAIGVMQLMPETGRDMAVGDITLLEPNIHAGTKYMRKIMDENFQGEAFNDLNRNLFAFACYNAGQGRIARLRKLAATRGLSANIWFDNVERVVAEQIGQETVGYVSNIFKYYVAYKLAEQQRAERGMVKDSVKQELREGDAGKHKDGFFKRLVNKVF